MIKPTLQSQEITEWIKKAQKQGIKAWRPIGVSRARIIKLYIMACHMLDPDDPQAASNRVRQRVDHVDKHRAARAASRREGSAPCE